MKELLRQLDPARFEAVHRSHIVNLDAVTRLRTIDDRRLELTLRDGQRLVASRSASERLRRLAR
jgi:DNA-binding LytR/AlgR family response regulator